MNEMHEREKGEQGRQRGRDGGRGKVGLIDFFRTSKTFQVI